VQQSTARVSALPRPVAAWIVAALLVCAAAAWLLTAKQASSMGMGGMAMMDTGIFLVTWLVMMVAMMFPSVAPIVLAHASVVRSRGEGVLPTVAFVAGYLIVWTAAGLVPLAVIQVLNSSFGMSLGDWLPRLGGAVIVVAGIYQLTPLKDVCLKACRSPLGFVLTHDFGGGGASAVRAGLSHGLYCLGCCWALMAVLAVLGLMNVAWMAAFAAVFFLEKNWRGGVQLSKAVGVFCLAGGIIFIAIG
jgi:predicted metal-binding membrane protein